MLSQETSQGMVALHYKIKNAEDLSRRIADTKEASAKGSPYSLPQIGWGRGYFDSPGVASVQIEIGLEDAERFVDAHLKELRLQLKTLNGVAALEASSLT